MPLPDAAPFRWQDGERLIRFGRGTLAEAPELLGTGYALLTTPRAEADAPGVVAGAAAVHHVRGGLVDEIAEELRGESAPRCSSRSAGGRVIDTAKALVAAGCAERVAAVPTTLSAAEMTAVHRHASGMPADTPRVRPAIVLNDPALCASQPATELAASAGNAFGHAARGPATVLAHPVARLAGHEAARLLARGVEADDEPHRDMLALGALLLGVRDRDGGLTACTT